MALRWTRIWCVRPVAMDTWSRVTPRKYSALVTRVTALGGGGDDEPGRRDRGQVLGRVDGEVGPPVEDGRLHLLREHALAAQLPDGHVEPPVALRLDHDELDRFRTRYDDLDPRQLDMVEAVTRGVVAKLLHHPTVVLKDAAGSSRGDRLVAALRELFEIEGQDAP